MIDKKNREIGRRIQMARKAAGFVSAVQAAEALGVNYRTYAGHENGNRNSINALPFYSKRFKVSVDWLLTGEGDMPLGEGEHKSNTGVTDVPLIAWVSAGQACFQEGIDNFDDFPTVQVSGLPKGKWIALHVDGQSMNKISPHNSIILVNMEDKDLVPNAYYVIMDEEGNVTYKRYRPKERPPFQPFSTQDIKPPKLYGSITIIGRVRRTITDM